MFSTGTPAIVSRRASAHISSKDEYDGRSHCRRAMPSFLKMRRVLYGHGARPYARATHGGTSRSSAAEHGISSTRLVPGRTAESYARKYGAGGASTESGPPLC